MQQQLFETMGESLPLEDGMESKPHIPNFAEVLAHIPQRIRLFSTKTLKPLGTLTYHTGTCYAIAFAHNISGKATQPEDEDEELTEAEKQARSRWLVSGGNDSRISLWELMSFEKT